MVGDFIKGAAIPVRGCAMATAGVEFAKRACDLGTHRIHWSDMCIRYARDRTGAFGFKDKSTACEACGARLDLS